MIIVGVKETFPVMADQVYDELQTGDIIKTNLNEFWIVAENGNYIDLSFGQIMESKKLCRSCRVVTNEYSLARNDLIKEKDWKKAWQININMI